MCFFDVSDSNYEKKMVHELFLWRKFLWNALANENIQDIRSIPFQKAFFFQYLPLCFESFLIVFSLGLSRQRSTLLHTLNNTSLQHICFWGILRVALTHTCLQTDWKNERQTEIIPLHQTIAAHRLEYESLIFKIFNKGCFFNPRNMFKQWKYQTAYYPTLNLVSLSGNSIRDMRTTLDMDQHTSNVHLKWTVQEKIWNNF